MWSEAEQKIIHNEEAILLLKGVKQKACTCPDQFIFNIIISKEEIKWFTQSDIKLGTF